MKKITEITEETKKTTLIIALGVIIILLCIVLFLAIRKEETDSELFASEYTEVGEDNVFVYRDSDEVIKLLKHGTGVVFLGFPECPWCQTYAKYLNEVAKEVGVDKIYYYNILEDRTNNTEVYQEIVSLLGDTLQYDDEGNYRIYVPNVTFIVGGKIVGSDYETSKDTNGVDTPEEYWTEEEINDLKNKLTTYMEEVYTSSNMCTTCNK